MRLQQGIVRGGMGLRDQVAGSNAARFMSQLGVIRAEVFDPHVQHRCHSGSALPLAEG
jgi:hypothetical protein